METFDFVEHMFKAYQIITFLLFYNFFSILGSTVTKISIIYVTSVSVEKAVTLFQCKLSLSKIYCGPISCRIDFGIAQTEHTVCEFSKTKALKYSIYCDII